MSLIACCFRTDTITITIIEIVVYTCHYFARCTNDGASCHRAGIATNRTNRTPASIGISVLASPTIGCALVRAYFCKICRVFTYNAIRRSYTATITCAITDRTLER